MSIIQSNFKKFPEGHLYPLLLILLLFIVYHSISDLAVAYNNQSILNLDFEGRENQSILNLDFEGRENQSILNLDFEGRENQSILNLDFERQNVSISPMVSSHFRTINYDNESSSLATANPLFGNNSLRVDIKPSNNTIKWNTISTDFIPINENAHYNYNFSLYLSAKDVNELHSKIRYFDLNKTEIKSANIFNGRDGTFEAPYNKISSSPNGTKYIKLQLLSKSNPNMSSSYIIDNLKIENVPFTNNNKDILSISTQKSSSYDTKENILINDLVRTGKFTEAEAKEFVSKTLQSGATNRPLLGNNSLRVDIKPSNNTIKWNTISTDFIPINENAHYNFSLYLSAKDVNELHSKIRYFDLNKTEIKSANIFNGRDGTFEAPYNKIDSSPTGTKYIKLQLLSKSNPNMSSSYIIDNLKIENVPFTNNNKDILSISTQKSSSYDTKENKLISDLVRTGKFTEAEAKQLVPKIYNGATNKPLLGNNSLRVDIKPSNNTIKWNTISTDFIPINENEKYNFSLYLSAKDVNELHSKIRYFDLNKTEIKSTNIFDGRDGTFEAPYNKIDSPPNGTKYIKLQLLSKSNPNISSSYIIDNVNLEEAIIPNRVGTNVMNNSDNGREQNMTKANRVA